MELSEFMDLYLGKGNMRKDIQDWLDQSAQLKKSMVRDVNLLSQIEKAAEILIDCFKKYGRKILVCGNGGSAGDSAHFVGELMNKFTNLRDYPLPAVDLSAPTALITAIGNDFSFDEVFSKQIRGIGKYNDVLFAISTSGTSGNIRQAIRQAIHMEMTPILLTGSMNNAWDNYSQVIKINVPSTSTPLIQEAHITIIHLLCHLIDVALEED